LTASDRKDSDWLLRAGALISNEARESKGQAWLVSRASSTSLTATRDEEEEKEKDAQSERSRRGSAAGLGWADDEFSPLTTRNMAWGSSRAGSRVGSRFGSRTHSRRNSRAGLGGLTPLRLDRDGRMGYFEGHEGDIVVEPDFVDVDDELIENDESLDDETLVRRLAKRSSFGLQGWVEKMLGWSLFAVGEEEEDDDDDDDETEDTTDESDASRLRQRERQRPNPEAHGSLIDGENIPAPKSEEGGWQDAAWLLSVATKVLL
jgi:hypothetical protein